jgi:hypothetical protein
MYKRVYYGYSVQMWVYNNLLVFVNDEVIGS